MRTLDVRQYVSSFYRAKRGKEVKRLFLAELEQQRLNSAKRW